MSANNSKSIEDKISDWMAEQGYPLEMAVAQAFKRSMEFVVQSDFYLDPDENKYREIDVVAIKSAHVNNQQLQIIFPIECKQSKKYPWVVFKSETFPLNLQFTLSQRIGTPKATQFLKAHANDKDIEYLDFFSVPGRTAYGITQALSKGKDVPYTAIMSAIKYSVAHENKITSIQKGIKPNLHALLFPIVVIEGRLFESFLDYNGNMKVTEIDHANLYWRNPVAGQPYSIVRISTLKDLSNLVSAVEMVARTLAMKFEKWI